MPDKAEAIPWPGDRPAALPALDERPLAEAWRLHWESDSTVERRHPSGRYRFDAPAGEFGRGADSLEACHTTLSWDTVSGTGSVTRP